MNVLFSHGKESGPWGAKIEALANVAQTRGFSVASPDYSEQPGPDARVEQLLNLRLPASELTVLVGSSMGGYVATLASQIVQPVGLFLMAPAFYLPGYTEQNPVPHARKTVIVHGFNDDVVPVENSIRFARQHNAELHLLDSDHRLNDQLPILEMLFGLFLDEVLEVSNVPKVLTWEKIAHTFGHEDYWVTRIWSRMVAGGRANYRTEAERTALVLKFIALADFYYTFLATFSRDRWGCDPYETAADFQLPNDILDRLLTDYIARQGHVFKGNATIQMALEELARASVYPVILEHFGGLDGIAASIYRASYPTFFDVDVDEYLTDPEDLDAEEIAMLDAFQSISEWLEIKFKPLS